MYGISNYSLVGSAEDILLYFLNASVNWQICYKTMPGGNLLPYDQAHTFDYVRRQAQFIDVTRSDTLNPLLLSNQ